MKKLLITINSAPTQDTEALEFVLAMLAFDHQVRLTFVGNGIFWLQTNQQARKLGGKSPQKLIAALEMYGCEHITYFENDIKTRGLAAANINQSAAPISCETYAAWQTDTDHCMVL
jgi:tRNA 2-thiouridine synthesizing protein C